MLCLRALCFKYSLWYSLASVSWSRRVCAGEPSMSDLLNLRTRCRQLAALTLDYWIDKVQRVQSKCTSPFDLLCARVRVLTYFYLSVCLCTWVGDISENPSACHSCYKQTAASLCACESVFCHTNTYRESSESQQNKRLLYYDFSRRLARYFTLLEYFVWSSCSLTEEEVISSDRMTHYFALFQGTNLSNWYFKMLL